MPTYSFEDVHISIAGPGGVVALGAGSGVADEGITIEMSGDKNTMTGGADGAVMHSLHASKMGKITVRLLKTSPTNSILQTMYNFQTSSSEFHGRNVITAQNTVSGDTSTGREAAFTRMPNIVYAKEGGTVDWVFDVGQIDGFLGAPV